MAPRDPTFLCVFHDLNVKYKLEDPSLALERVTGDPGYEVFHMSLTVSGDWSLGIGGINFKICLNLIKIID